ncbi:winged helix-turn-helix transcriptional regulator [Arthrobacter sp. ISL-85]|uniref:MarR family winged helix-turn-helix transcriptional regulator n=1 Tax=Arthrobacter sp. ISL-85 TaxID=2819115 RepID=UPI001BE60DB2|nr:MarR family winged helix-turn-helix transcriptional regulator [Arthrobacter sp. ISL-85]MBT2565979.1 winged helix-turn-helix transcriptional regulator [Arthrobacter sp. ISL-85]
MAGDSAPGTPPSDQAGPQSGHPLLRILQEFTLEANRYVDAAGDRKDMHRTDMNALAVIMRHTARGNVVTPGLLRKELNLSSPATTALIDRLDSSGHVVRERHSTDRRQVQLKMTPKAFQEGGAIFAPLAQHMGSAIGRFSEEELETVTRFMTAMIEATVAARTESG